MKLSDLRQKRRREAPPVVPASTPEDSSTVGDVVELLDWQPPQLGDWCRQVDREPDPEYLIEGLVPADGLGQISGPAKRAMKTYTAIALAGVIATGTEYSAFKPMDPGGLPTLMILQEGARKGTRRRFSLFSASLGVDMEQCDHLYIEHRNPHLLIDRPVWVDRISRFVRAQNIKFLIVDTLAMVATHDENRVEDVMETMRCLHQIRQANGCTVMFIHHTRKVMEKAGVVDIDEDSRGSSSIAGVYDVHFGLRRRAQNQTHIDLVVRQKEAEDQLFKVEWAIDEYAAHMAVTPTDRGDQFETMKQIVLRALVPGQQYTQGNISDLVSNSAEGRRILAALLRDGIMEQTGRYYRLTGKCEYQEEQ